jgi:hypothetical protein
MHYESEGCLLFYPKIDELAAKSDAPLLLEGGKYDEDDCDDVLAVVVVP